MAKLEIVKRLEVKIRDLEKNLERKTEEFEIELFLKNSAFSFMIEQQIFPDYERYFDRKHLKNFNKIKNL